jgi:hypothetical protein
LVVSYSASDPAETWTIPVWYSVADPDPGSGAFLPPGSGIRIRDEFFPDPGSRIPDPRGMFFGDIFLRILLSLIFY